MGLTFDNKLTFDSHKSTLCQKAGKQVQILSRLSYVLNESNKLLLQWKAIKYITLDFSYSFGELLNSVCRYLYSLSEFINLWRLYLKFRMDYAQVILTI